MHQKGIALIGMPGIGKSTVGILLANTLGMRFVDTDILIQEKEGATLIDIIRDRGIERFQRIEEEVLSGLSGDGTVIATGGSAVLLPAAMKHLAEIADIVYLEADLMLIRKRLWNFKTRGIVSTPGKTITDIFNERRPLYRKYSKIKVRVRGKKPGQIVSEIVDRSKETEMSGGLGDDA